MDGEHLDRALAEEFAGHGRTIRRLRLSDANFRVLLELNHTVWEEIQKIQSGVIAASEAYLTSLERHRLKVLDEIAAAISRAEAKDGAD